MSLLSNNAGLYGARRVKNIIAQVLAILATIFGLFWLVWIMWTTLSKGLGSINLALFTQMTPPPGDEGGMLNAFFGSIVMSLMGIAFGAPIGVLAGTFLAEYSQKSWIGETMAVTFVLGNAHELTASLLMPGNSIAATIANEFSEADSEMYRSSLIALGFVLFLVTFIVLTIARLMLRQLSRKEGN